jgi:hypothetical protein
MRTQAVTCRTSWTRLLTTHIPLNYKERCQLEEQHIRDIKRKADVPTMQVKGHIDNIVLETSYLVNRQALKILK